MKFTPPETLIKALLFPFEENKAKESICNVPKYHKKKLTRELWFEPIKYDSRASTLSTMKTVLSYLK